MPTPFPTQFTTRTPVATDNHDIRIAKGEARQLSLEADFSLLLAGIPGIANLTQFVNDAVATSGLYVTVASGPYLTTTDAALLFLPATSLTFDAFGNLIFPATAEPDFSGLVLPPRDTTNLLISGPAGSLVYDATEKCVKFMHPDNLIWSKLIATSPTDVVADTGATYSVVPADNGRVITLSHGSAVTVTLDASSQSFTQPGFTCKFIQIGVGQVSFAAAGGLTVNSLAGNLKISGRYGAVTLTTTAAGSVVLDGNLTA